MGRSGEEWDIFGEGFVRKWAADFDIAGKSIQDAWNDQAVRDKYFFLFSLELEFRQILGRFCP